MKRTRWLVSVLGVSFGASAQAAPVRFNHRMETSAACDPALGRVRLRMDVFGAFGISTSQGDSASFDPANDVPDQRAQGTVYNSMGFLCAEQRGARTGHIFEAAEMVGVATVADGVENLLTSQFDAEGVRVVTISRDHMIIFTHKGDTTNGHGFLADVKMQETTHATALIMKHGDLLKAADTDHFAIQLDFFISCKLGVDRMLGGSGGFRGGHKESVRLGRRVQEASVG
jgi:hypothetical protein